MSSGTVDRGRSGVRVAEPKLLPPRVHPRMVKRRRLLDVLDREADRPLTLVKAGVGYGKTTLVRSWCIERPEPVIWLTLDAADDDPVRLWTHLAFAVHRLGDGLADRALASLRSRGAPVESAVDEVMNALLAYGGPVTIVLDDLHTVRSEASLGSIGYAIERLPDGIRVVALTRSDPPIGAGRLRARRALTEVRARDLAFTVDEASELMTREGIELSAESVEVLVRRTEGWSAGLYLAALWLRELDDPDEGVRTFGGNARDVGDYLSDEVLSALDPGVRDFLARTSVLARLTPALCDAVLGRRDSEAVLAELARSNVFLVALDPAGEWYRYHHLFAEVLQLELGRAAAPELRRRAAAWCRAQGLVEDAIAYAADAGDAEMVAEVLAEHHLAFIWAGRLRQLLGWIRWLPAELLSGHPVLGIAGAAAAALLGCPEVEVRQLLAVAEETRERRPELWSDYLEAAAELTRAEVIDRGDVAGAIEHARRAVTAARAGAEVLIVGALATLAQGLFFAGDLEQARTIALETVESRDASRATNGYAGALGLLALVDAEEGRSQSAEAWGLQAIEFARETFQSDSWIVSFAHLALALVRVGQGRLDEAEREALRGEQLRRASHPTIGHAHALLMLAQVRTARSRLARAASDLQRARQMIGEFTDPGRLATIADGVARELAAARAADGRELVEEPSPAERAVLEGLAAGLSRREIGAQLYISLNTVKSHTRELYRKLGVTSGAEAVARAGALGLLDAAESPG